MVLEAWDWPDVGRSFPKDILDARSERAILLDVPAKMRPQHVLPRRAVVAATWSLVPCSRGVMYRCRALKAGVWQSFAAFQPVKSRQAIIPGDVSVRHGM